MEEGKRESHASSPLPNEALEAEGNEFGDESTLPRPWRQTTVYYDAEGCTLEQDATGKGLGRSRDSAENASNNGSVDEATGTRMPASGKGVKGEGPPRGEQGNENMVRIKDLDRQVETWVPEERAASEMGSKWESPVVKEMKKRAGDESDDFDDSSDDEDATDQGDSRAIPAQAERESTDQKRTRRRKPFRWLYKRALDVNRVMKETFTPGSGSDVPDSASDAGVNASEHAPSTTECPPMKVHINRKSYKEFTDMRSVQDLHAHEGIIWTMKFSLDGRYLATGGRDKKVKVWQIVTENDISEQKRRGEPWSLIKSEPVRSYEGHSVRAVQKDVLDLCWSSTKFVLSGSMDRTVRLWHLTLDECLRTFTHPDFVVSAEFNPTSDKYFVSGGLDGMVRLWYIPDHMVVNYARTSEMVTAASFSTDGKRVVAGSSLGKCRFYDVGEGTFELASTVDVRNRRGSHSKGRKITGIHFFPADPKKLLISSNDSRIRVYDSYFLRCKYKGHKNRNSQIRSSFSPCGDFIISGSEREWVYIWSTVNTFVPSINPIYTGYRKDKHSSYELFEVPEGIVTVALFAPEPVRQVANSYASRQNVQNAEEGPNRAAEALMNSRFRSTSNVPQKSTSGKREDKEALEAGEMAVKACSSVGQVIFVCGYTGTIRVYENFGCPKWV